MTTTAIHDKHQRDTTDTHPATTDSKVGPRLNALKHGLLSGMTVLPSVERQEEWDDHFGQMEADLQPIGYLENVLAQRVALLAWRLRRAARYERDAAAIRLENAPIDQANRDNYGRARNPTPLAEKVKATLETTQRRFEIVESLSGMPADHDISPSDAAKIVLAAAEAAGLDTDDPDGFPCGSDGFPSNDSLDRVRWSAGKLVKAIESIASHAEADRGEMLDYLGRHFTARLESDKAELAGIQRELDQHLRQRVIPDDRDLEKITRYEAHLERCLYKALHELQRLQAARKSGNVPAPMAMDVTIDTATTNAA